MKPIPVAFHIGPLEVHTYGIGLAITFWFAFRYFERRLRHSGYRVDWVPGMFLWVIAAAIVGARAMHVVANAGYYGQHPAQIVAVWQGGLSSFGGLLLAVPTAIVVTRRRCPELGTLRALDIVAPVLMAAWAMGRLLGPQLMVAGGGHPTTQWFGMYYAGQPGRRLPVPIFQAVEDFTVYCVLIALEHYLNRWPDGSRRAGYPPGAVLAVGMVLWGIERTVDEHLWLGEDGRVGSILVQIAGVALAVGGIVLLVNTGRRWRRWLDRGAPGGHPGDEGPPIAASPEPEARVADPGRPAAATAAGDDTVPAEAGRDGVADPPATPSVTPSVDGDPVEARADPGAAP
jgi:phosphatidylglycerol:prolipoprotein diacylglycerol transferase